MTAVDRSCRRSCVPSAAGSRTGCTGRCSTPGSPMAATGSTDGRPTRAASTRRWLTRPGPASNRHGGVRGMAGGDVAWWSFGVAATALIVSIFNSVWQYREARRRRKPDVVVSARFVPRAEPGEHPDRSRVQDQLSGTVEVAGPATVVAAGVAPPRGRRGWTESRAVFPSRVGPPPHDLPIVVNDSRWIIVDLPDPLPPGITREGGARLWVRTSSGHLFASRVVAPLRVIRK